MRPGVYASVLRTRKSGVRRSQPTAHKFSWRRFCIMVFVGAILFIPGLIVTIIGLETEESLTVSGDRVLYKVIGPASLACGCGMLFAAAVYYCCWGFQRPIPRHTSPPTVPAISLPSHNAYSSVRQHQSPTHHRGAANGNGASSPSPDIRSDRHGHHHHSHQHYRSSSKSSTDSGMRRHRSSNSPNSHHSHSADGKRPADDKHVTDNQVAFTDTDAPLAQGETGSVDISIDIDATVDHSKAT